MWQLVVAMSVGRVLVRLLVQSGGRIGGGSLLPIMEGVWLGGQVAELADRVGGCGDTTR